MQPRYSSSTRLWCRVLAGLSLYFGGAFLSAAPLEEKRPAPDEDSIVEARQLAQEIYRERWEAAETTAQKAVLARQVIKNAEDSAAGTANYYALLVIARNMAVAAGNVEAAVRSIDLLAAEFQIDDIALQGSVLTKIAAKVDSRSQRRYLVDCSLRLAVRAIVGDRLDVARQMAELASREAPNTDYPGLAVESKQCEAVVSALQQEYPGVEKARADLAKDPKDPTAARIVGRYECFCKAEWPKGLPLLAQSDDELLRKLAARTLAEIGSPEKAMELGNAWWQVAQGLEGWHQHTVRAYAASLYGKVDRKLAGFDKQVRDKRLGEVRQSTYLALSRRFVRKAKPDVNPGVKPAPIQKPKNVIVKGQSRADDWTKTGKWRLEGSGIRLFGGRTVIESKQEFVGDFAITIRYKVTTPGNHGAQELWIEMWGERFEFRRSEGVAELRRKGVEVEFVWTNKARQILLLKAPGANLPSTIKIHLGTRDIWNRTHEILIPSIQIDGTAVR